MNISPLRKLLGVVNSLESIEKQIAYLERITQYSHDASEHHFVENKEQPGTCVSCGWIDPDALSGCKCGESLREHAVQMLKYASSVQGIAGLIQFVLPTSVHSSAPTHQGNPYPFSTN